MAYTIAQLAAEITNDPAARGYKLVPAPPPPASNWKSDQEIADLLNEPKADVTPWPDAVVAAIKRTDVTAQEVLEAIDIRDFTYPGTAQLPAASQPLATAWLESATRQEFLRFVTDAGVDTTVLKNLKLMLVTTGQGSTARINALATRPGSRAESLWGRGTIIPQIDVARAAGRG